MISNLKNILVSMVYIKPSALKGLPSMLGFPGDCTYWHGRSLYNLANVRYLIHHTAGVDAAPVAQCIIIFVARRGWHIDYGDVKTIARRDT